MKIIQQIIIIRPIEGLIQVNLKNIVLKLLIIIKSKLKFYQVIFLNHNQKNQVFLSNKIRKWKKHFIKLTKIVSKFNNYLSILTLRIIIKTEFILLTIEDWSLRSKVKRISST
jgi:hypothetical protein